MRGFPSSVAVAAALAVVACTPAPPDPGNPYPGTTVSRPAPARTEPPPGPRVASRPAPADSAPVPEAPAAKAVTPPPKSDPLPEPDPLPDPGELSGLGAEAIRNRLGEPVFARIDPPAALWQYRRGGCVLDLYLFETESRLSVRHFEFRPDPRQRGADTGTPLDARKCYAALIRAQDTRAGR